MSTETPALPATGPAKGRVLAALLPVWPFAAILGLFVVLAALAPLIAPYDPASQNLLARLQPPGFAAGGKLYLLGTDEVGRDLLSRILYGARISLSVGFVSVCASLAVGAWLGMLAGYFRGLTETIVMRATDIVLSIPPILLAILMWRSSVPACSI